MNRITEVNVQNNSVSLSGSLVWNVAENTSVVVLMLHGSGPLDRDANMPGQKLDIFSAIAAALDAAGISSYRYDKRGCGQSGGTYDKASFTDLIKDACAAVDMLASIPEINFIVLLGHSEGTMIAPVVAQLKPEVSGLILLCPTIWPVEETLMRQAEHFAKMVEQMPGVRGVITRIFARMRGGILNEQRILIDRIKTTEKDACRSKGQSVPTKLLRGLLAHDPMSWIKKMQVPALAISGVKDIQCLPGDAQMIKDLAQGPVECHCLSDLTHILRADSAPGSFHRYADLMAKKLDPRVPQLCIDWILRQDWASRRK